MRLLFDECTPRDLAPYLLPHVVEFVEELGWKGKQNGQLLQLASASGRFDVLVTTDVNLYSQQEVALYGLGVLVLRAYRNSFEALLPLTEQALEKLETLPPGTLEFLYNEQRLRESDRRRKRGPFATNRQKDNP